MPLKTQPTAIASEAAFAAPSSGPLQVQRDPSSGDLPHDGIRKARS